MDKMGCGQEKEMRLIVLCYNSKKFFKSIVCCESNYPHPILFFFINLMFLDIDEIIFLANLNQKFM